MIAITVDTVVLALDPRGAQHHHSALLIRRNNDPFKDLFALPGGFVDETDADLEIAAKRELEEETGLKLSGLKQWYSVGNAWRDPRGWTVTNVFTARVDQEYRVVGGDDAKEALWFPVTDLPELAFDHEDILFNVVQDARTFTSELATKL